MDIPRWLKSHKHLSGHYLTLAVALGTLSGYLLILQAWLLAQVISRVVFAHQALADVMHLMWGMLAVFSFRAILSWLSEQIAFRAAVQVKLQLRQQVYEHLQQLASPVYLRGERSGALANAVMDGIEALEAYYARYLPAMSLMALVPISILVFVFPFDWISALVMLFTAPLIPLFMIFIGKGAEKRNQQQWQQLARMSAHFLDMIQGLTTLKLFNASRREAQAIAQVSDEYKNRTMSVLRVAFLSSFTLEFFSTVSIAMVAVLIGFRLFYGEMDFVYGFFVLLLAPEFYAPLRNMGTHYHARMDAIGAAEKLIDILNTPVPEKPVQGYQSFQAQQLTIQFQQVSFVYPDGQQALADIDVTIQPGEQLALVGSSGAGKTTFTQLLLGFLQVSEGELLVNGLRLQDIHPEHWRRHIAWVPQQPRLFYGSIMDNIRLGDANASLEQVKQAARCAYAHEFIEALPYGYSTLVGERGQGLSGGQIQRVALARAFLRDAPLVIMDEATANLDRESEQLVQQAIQSLAQHRTMVMVAHRLSTIAHADRILVFDKGRIIQQGFHTALQQQPGRYQEMLQAYGSVS